MRLTFSSADRRRMKAYIAAHLPEDGIEVVLADGLEGEVRADLDPVRYDDGEWDDLHWETNCREAVGLRDIYEHFRRKEMALGEWRLEVTASRTPTCLPEEVVVVNANVTSQRKLLTPKECRERFQNKISLRQVYDLFYLGEIEGFRVGRKVLLFDDSVEAYIGRNRNKPVSRDHEPQWVQEPTSETQVDPIKPKERPQRRQPSGFQFFHLPEGR